MPEGLLQIEAGGKDLVAIAYLYRWLCIGRRVHGVPHEIRKLLVHLLGRDQGWHSDLFEYRAKLVYLDGHAIFPRMPIYVRDDENRGVNQA